MTRLTSLSIRQLRSQSRMARVGALTSLIKQRLPFSPPSNSRAPCAPSMAECSVSSSSVPAYGSMRRLHYRLHGSVTCVLSYSSRYCWCVVRLPSALHVCFHRQACPPTSPGTDCCTSCVTSLPSSCSRSAVRRRFPPLLAWAESGNLNHRQLDWRMTPRLQAACC